LVNKAKYWTIRAAVVIGGAAVGWFAPTLLANIAKSFLVTLPTLVLNIIVKVGATVLGVTIIKEMFKAILYTVGSTALTYKNCPISNSAYSHAIYGNGISYTSSALNTAIKNNQYFKTTLSGVLTGTSVANKKIPLNFNSSNGLDLYLSIGKVDLYATGGKSNGKWNLAVSGSDYYNFDSLRLGGGFSLGNVANDAGVIM
jgi:hypothetical protein